MCKDCGKSCTIQAVRCQRCYRLVMAARNAVEAPHRMRTKNPMWMPGIRNKMVKTLRKIGHKPKLRGGNGRPLPVPQKKLADALGWPTEFVVRTGMSRGSGFPSCYKIDIANERLMIAIEVDGYSHGPKKRQKQDLKKENFLSALGWKVFRFKNKQVTDDVSACVRFIRSNL